MISDGRENARLVVKINRNMNYYPQSLNYYYAFFWGYFRFPQPFFFDRVFLIQFASNR